MGKEKLDKIPLIGSDMKRSLVLKTEGSPIELIRITEDGRIFVRGVETTDDGIIGQALKIFALYFPSTK